MIADIDPYIASGNDFIAALEMPSIPGARFDGRFLITPLISSLVVGVIIWPSLCRFIPRFRRILMWSALSNMVWSATS